MYGQFEVDHEPGGRKCTAVTVEYYTLREGEGEGEVAAHEWQVVIQPWPSLRLV